MKLFKSFLLVTVMAVSALQAGSYTKTKYVKVKKVKKFYKYVNVSRPHQECYYERVPIQSTHYERYKDERTNQGGAVVGGILGGIAGHQFGGGRGNDVATVAGAIIGSMVGSNVANQNRYRTRAVTRTTYQDLQRCHTVYRNKKIRVKRYKNIGYYKGKRIVKISKKKLRRIPVRVTVRY